MPVRYISRATAVQFIPLIGKHVAPGEEFESPVELNNANFELVKPATKYPAKPVEDK